MSAMAPESESESASAADKAKFGDVAEQPDVVALALEEWLVDNGSEFPALNMQNYGSEVRGVHASRDIEKGEVLVSVPAKCLITVEMGKATDVGQAVMAAELDLDAPKHVYLMLYLLLERKKADSFFAPYFAILPPTLSNMPIFWSLDELAWLEGSHLLLQIEERKHAIETDYAAICDVFPRFAADATLTEFKWARMCVCSRNFGVVIDGLRTSALVPYADMLNHYRPRETKWTFDNSRGAFTITSLSPLASGGQVYDSYGQKCNHRFLLNYGFSIESNVEADGSCPNEVPLLVALDPDDPAFTAKAPFWLRDGGGPGPRRVRVSTAENDNARAALSLLRVGAASAHDLAEMTEGLPYVYRTAKDVRYPISVENEKAAMELLLTTCKKLIAAYPTSLAADRVALASSALEPFSNKRHALIQVRGEKEVLHHYVDHASTALEMLAADDDTFDARLESIFQTKGPAIGAYVADVVGHLRTAERRRSGKLPDDDLGQKLSEGRADIV